LTKISLRSLPKQARRFVRILSKWTQSRKRHRFYSPFIKPNDLVFDIGASRGSHTEIYLKQKARVISVEPQKECVRGLFIRYHDNPDVHIVPEAVGDAEGTAEMLIYRNYNYRSSLSRENARAQDRDDRVPFSSHDEVRTVKVTTLDQLIKKFGVPSFIKIDAEGYEYKILKGLSHPVKALSFEFLPVHPEPAIKSIEYLKRFGSMSLNIAIMDRMKFMLKDWVRPEEMIKVLKSLEKRKDFIYSDVYVRFSLTNEKSP